MNESRAEAQLDLFGGSERVVECRERSELLEARPGARRGEAVWRCLCDRPLREARGKLVCEVCG